MDQNMVPPRPTVDQLRHVAFNYPIIDHHAHNLILPAQTETVPLETITTEAQGRALRDTFKSLPHLRAAKQLRQLYACGEDADWEDILEQRVEWLRSNPDRLHQQCFEGVHALLIDDGLAAPDKVYPLDHHDRFTKTPTKRIVRIEAVAERLMRAILRKANEDDLGESKFLPNTWIKFTDEFEREIQDSIADPDVAGFKTVICYRTGLDVEPDYEEAAKAVGHPFERYVKSCIRKRSYRIEKKAVNDYLVLRTLEILSERKPHSDNFAKPLQFHTGLGDNDVNLVDANPALLQQLMENYPNVPFVLLHAAYPYTREAGYLATVYRHVYLDMGEIFPMVSRDGQRAVIRQAMELAPGSKLLYSSDGRWFPETFYLANLEFREVWLEVLLDMISHGDITPFQGIGMTKDILFNNANLLYNLRYAAVFDERVQDVSRQLTYTQKPGGSSPTQTPLVPPTGRTPEPSRTRSVSPFTPATFPPPPTVPQVYDSQLLKKFQQENSKIRFVNVQWLDCLGEIKARIVPMKELERLVQEGDRIEISQDELRISTRHHSDPGMPAPIVPPRLFVEPDLRSLRPTYTESSLPIATIFSYWRDEAGSAVPYCPRNNLEVLISGLQYNYNATLLVGFEIQVTLLTKTDRPLQVVSEAKSSEWLQRPVFTDMVMALDEVGIEMQQCFAGPGSSQYNFVLTPQPPLLAVDTYVQTRQVISQIAAQHDIKATFHPVPFEGASRTTARASISLQPPDKDMQFFAGGILSHLPALCAFSMPESTSYDMDSSPTQWVAWSTQSTTTPLRRARPGQWDLRCFDGLSNMYIALSAFIAAGLLGLASGATPDSPSFPLDAPPYPLDEQTRAQYRITQPMPRSAGEALYALQGDGPLAEALAPGVVAEYIRGFEDRDRENERLRNVRTRNKGKERADVEGSVPRLPDLPFSSE